MILVSHPTANAFNRALTGALHRDGLLSWFHTTLAFGRRRLELPRERIVQHAWPEIARLGAKRFGFRSVTKGWDAPFGIDAVYRALDRSVAASLGAEQAVYCYEDGALATFRRAAELGSRRIYELPIAYYERVQRLLTEEAERLPEWAPTLGATDDPPAKLERKAEELRLAELVICPSQFVRESLPPGTPALIAEFGSPPPAPERLRRVGGPLRVLFAGSLTQRKGLADLFRAMAFLGRSDVELVVLGAAAAPIDFYRRQYSGFIYEAPRSHAAALELMESCDVLALPSIVEGRALVQQEALSRGLPLLVTRNAGGEDLIKPGVTGWLVPIRDPEAIAERLNWFAENRAALPEMAVECKRLASERTWAAYTGAIIAPIKTLLPSERGRPDCAGDRTSRCSA